MSQKEKEAYLADLHVGVLAINEPGLGPLTVPIWYDYTPGGRLWMITGTESRKGRLLKLGERVSLAAQSEAPPYKYVSVEGPITEIKTLLRRNCYRWRSGILGNNREKLTHKPTLRCQRDTLSWYQ